MFTTAPVNEEFLSSLTLQATEIDEARLVSTEELPNYVDELRAAAVRSYVQN